MWTEQGIEKIRTETEYKKAEIKIIEEQESTENENIDIREVGKSDRRLDTPKDIVRSQLPEIPSTPIVNNETLSQMLIEQESFLCEYPIRKEKAPKNPNSKAKIRQTV